MSASSFFEKIGSFFVGLFKKAPTIEQQISATISYVAPLAVSILTLVDPADAGEADPIVATIQADLATLKAVTTGVTLTPSAVQTSESALNSINSNAAAILALASVKNSAKKTQIEAAIGLITQEANAILSNLPSIAAGAPASPSAS